MKGADTGLHHSLNAIRIDGENSDCVSLKIDGPDVRKRRPQQSRTMVKRPHRLISEMLPTNRVRPVHRSDDVPGIFHIFGIVVVVSSA
jgi:hypothetical protein